VTLAQHPAGAFLQPLARRTEAAVAGVLDECGIVGEVQPAAGERAEAEIVFLAVAEGEAGLVEESEVVEEYAPDVEADADAGREARTAPLRDALHEGRERVDVAAGRQQVLLETARHRAERGVVRQRRDRAAVAGGGGCVDQLLEPAGGDDRVAIEQHYVVRRCTHTAVHAAGESEAFVVAQNLGRMRGGERSDRPFDRRLLRPVDHEHDCVPREVGVRGDTGEAARELVGSAVDRHDDVDPLRRLRRRPSRAAHPVERPPAHRIEQVHARDCRGWRGGAVEHTIQRRAAPPWSAAACRRV
jgi:hypothetical protein